MLLINPFWHVFLFFFGLVIFLPIVYSFCFICFLALNCFLFYAFHKFDLPSQYLLVIFLLYHLVSSFLAPEGTLCVCVDGGDLCSYTVLFHYFTFSCIDFAVTVIKENVTTKKLLLSLLLWFMSFVVFFRSWPLWRHQSMLIL